jgi:excisionase family DNA binding protein
MTEHISPQTPERWLSKRSVAEYYSVGLRTVERWIHRGCPSRMVAGVRRLRLSEVESFLTATQGRA